jgi:transposase-like protein
VKQFAPIEELFKGRHFDREVVVVNVRWYLSYKLSSRDLVAMMSERGLDLAHTTILRWGAALHARVSSAGAVSPELWAALGG